MIRFYAGIRVIIRVLVINKSGKSRWCGKSIFIIHIRGVCMCVSECVCVCVCMCMHVCACVCACVYVCACVCVCLCECVCVCARVSECACVSVLLSQVYKCNWYRYTECVFFHYHI